MKLGRWATAVWLVLAFTLGAPCAAKNTLTLILTNAQGTVVAKMDMQGNVKYTSAYRPYGKQQVGSPQPGPGYTGHFNDPDTGLVYMQQRYYDPAIGRFLSVDPLTLSPGSVFNFNRFVYANNSPIRFIDPNGEKPGDLFSTPEQAAYDALTFINGKSIETDREYLGYIIVVGKQFMATQPVQRSEDRGNAPFPNGKKVVGDYHTHGHYAFKTKDGKYILTDKSGDNLNSDSYSGFDLRRYTFFTEKLGQYRGYLGTPGGHYYVWYKGQVYDLANQVRQQQEQQKKEQEQQQQEREREQKKEKDQQQSN